MSEPDCGELLERLNHFIDGELDEVTCADVRAHLERCQPCLKSADFEAAFKRLVANSCKEAAPEGLLERMKQMLD